MAEKQKNSRAEKAVSGSKKKSEAQNAGKNTTPAKKTSRVSTEYERALPVNAVVACVSIFLFILFLVISINPEGALLKVIQSVVLGLIGKAGFYISIPGLLYIFIIHVFCRKTAVTMRSTCILLFVLSCGSIYHLAVQTQGMAAGFAVISDLYVGGVEGYTGGVICGGVALLLRWLCGTPISYILLGILAVFTLLGAMQITLPSIIRAIANRPRDDFQEDGDDTYIEPAAIVVNHIANRQIQHKRQMREKKLAASQAAATNQGSASVPEKASRAEKSVRPAEKSQHPGQVLQAPELPQQEPVPSVGTPANAAGVMSTIDLDIEAPVIVSDRSARGKQESVPERGVPVTVDEEPFLSSTPSKMPELDIPAFVKQSELMCEKEPEPAPKKQGEGKKVTAKETEASAKQVAREIAGNQKQEPAPYCFPPIDLLKKPVRGAADGTEEMRENSRRLNETLASFRIDAHIINVTRGPSVTRYEVELDKGVRLNKLTTCADDIALSLGASGVRIAAVPGKISIVGIEVPNRSVTTVSLREVIDSPEFAKAKSKSSFAVGKDIGGSCIVGNIAKMPHMLIAGTTGSGKSVCMNSIIISLLYKAGPEDVKLIMVDPKMVELGIYNGIPHLLIPVVTDPKKAAGSLQWAVTEMLRRYKLMSDEGVRDLESYNSIVMAEEGGQKLPQVIIIIDELADLMLVAAKEVEDSICRIAQMGRAAGMHLIIATQRPSADVITGLMKANIPSRIAFSVASAMESRIILDTQGAEKLVGKGDMLFAPIGIGKPLRVQGCFVTDSEVEAVAGYVKDHYVADYNQQVLQEIEQKAQQAGKSKGAADPEPTEDELEGDEMLPAAVDVILETGQASVSMLQRRLKLGYARAARIVDEMEEKGIVGPFQGSKPRDILITKEKWAAMRNGQQMEFSDLEENL